MKKYYECHITIEPPREAASDTLRRQALRELVQRDVELSANTQSGHTGWKFSAIDGDPVLGVGVKFYATTHFSSRRNARWVRKELDTMAAYLSIACEHRVLRKKIEFVIWDERTENSV